MPSIRKPGFVPLTAWMPRSMSAAQTSITTQPATCAARSTPRSRSRGPPPIAQGRVRSGRVACRAGARPNANTEPTVATMVKAMLATPGVNWMFGAVSIIWLKSHAGATLRHRQAEGTTGRRWHDALDEQLPDQPRPDGPERQSRADSALPLHRARQQQVADVATGHQQHDQHRCLQEAEHERRLVPESRARQQCGVGERNALGLQPVLAREGCGDGLELGGRPARGDAGTKPAEYRRAAPSRRDEQWSDRLVERAQQPQRGEGHPCRRLPVARSPEARWRDADNREGHAVEPYTGAHYCVRCHRTDAATCGG